MYEDIKMYFYKISIKKIKRKDDEKLEFHIDFLRYFDIYEKIYSKSRNTYRSNVNKKEQNFIIKKILYLKLDPVQLIGSQLKIDFKLLKFIGNNFKYSVWVNLENKRKITTSPRVSRNKKRPCIDPKKKSK